MRLWREKRTWFGKRARHKAERLAAEDVTRIGIIKHAAFGDLLCTRPFLITLREYFPQAQLSFSAISHYQRGIPHDLVDRVHIIPGNNQKASPLERYKAMRELGHQHILFDLTESTPALLQSWLTPADLKIGFQHRGLHKWFYDAAILRAEYRFEAETFLEQLHILGLPYELPLRYDFPAEPLKRARRYVVYFPTASHENKSWPKERMQKLIQRMAEQYPQYDHIVLSGLADWERDWARQITDSLSEQANVLLQIAGEQDNSLLKGSLALVANDTGIRHLGIALGIPTVGIFFHAIPFGYWPRFAQHDVAFETNGSPPSVERVALALERILATD